MGAIASQITTLTTVYSTVYSDADQRKHQSSASLAFVWRIHRGPVNSPHKWSVTRNMFPFDDVIKHTTISVNSLRPRDSIGRHKSGLTLAHGMACYLTTPSHYLNQCWLFMNEFCDIHLKQFYMKRTRYPMSLKIIVLKWLSRLPGANELNHVNKRCP